MIERTAARVISLGPAAAAMRRQLSPLSWCALEAVVARVRTSDNGSFSDVSVRSLASELAVATNTAQRALKKLRGAGLIEQSQRRDHSGRFDTISYRVTIPPDVLLVESGSAPSIVREVSHALRVVERRVVPASLAVEVGEQLSLRFPSD